MNCLERPGPVVIANVLHDDAVVVVDEEAGSLPRGRRLAELLLDPRQRWVGRDVHVDSPAGADLHDDEDADDREERSVLGQEVTRPDLLDVVLNESAPGLGLAGAIGAPDERTVLPVSGLTTSRERSQPDQSLRRRAQKTRSPIRSRWCLWILW